MNDVGFPVYDFKKDAGYVLVTPQMRARFMRMDPGTETAVHSHDLGDEVFLVLQGKAVLEIDGRSEELAPGQMCVALAGQVHKVRVTSDEPMIMYLSVAPHIEPTHTAWTANGKRQPHTFFPPDHWGGGTETTTSVDGMIDRVVSAVGAFADAAQLAAGQARELGTALKQALADNDGRAASDTRNSMCDALFPLYQRMYELASVWNELAPRVVKGP